MCKTRVWRNEALPSRSQPVEQRFEMRHCPLVFIIGGGAFLGKGGQWAGVHLGTVGRPLKSASEFQNISGAHCCQLSAAGSEMQKRTVMQPHS
jgi:hypothetical protein